MVLLGSQLTSLILLPQPKSTYLQRLVAILAIRRQMRVFDEPHQNHLRRIYRQI